MSDLHIPCGPNYTVGSFTKGHAGWGLWIKGRDGSKVARVHGRTQRLAAHRARLVIRALEQDDAASEGQGEGSHIKQAIDDWSDDVARDARSIMGTPISLDELGQGEGE